MVRLKNTVKRTFRKNRNINAAIEAEATPSDDQDIIRKRDALIAKYKKQGSKKSSPMRQKKKKYKYNREGYDSPAYKKFIEEVKKRDNCRCQMPGCKKHTFGIEVHHIIRHCDAPGLRFFVSNAICLCHTHHKAVTGNEYQYAGLFHSIVLKNSIEQRH